MFALLKCYFYALHCLKVSEYRLSHYMIKSTLNWLDLISIEKTKMADSNDGWRRLHCLSCLQFAKDKVKHIYLKISLKFLEICICLCIGIFLRFYFERFELFKWQKKSRQQKRAGVIQWFCFSRWHLQMPTWVRKAEIVSLKND